MARGGGPEPPVCWASPPTTIHLSPLLACYYTPILPTYHYQQAAQKALDLDFLVSGWLDEMWAALGLFPACRKTGIHLETVFVSRSFLLCHLTLYLADDLRQVQPYKAGTISFSCPAQVSPWLRWSAAALVTGLLSIKIIDEQAVWFIVNCVVKNTPSVYAYILLLFNWVRTLWPHFWLNNFS